MMKRVLDTKWASLNVVITVLWISVFRNGFIGCSVQFSRSVVSDSLPPHGLQHARLHLLPELAQTQVIQVNDAIKPSHPLLSPSPPAFYLAQHQGLFQWVGPLHQVAKVLKLHLQHQSFQCIFRVHFLWDWLVWFPCSPRGSQESSPTPQFKSINSSVLSFLYGPTHMTTGKTIALIRRTFVSKVMSQLFNMLSRLVIAFLPKRKHLLIS